jgi:ArsR family transcriptional regulator
LKEINLTVSTTTPAGPPASACCAPALPPNADLDVERVVARAKALSDPVRVEIADLLSRHDEPLCQCELTPLFDLSQPTLSHHLKVLRDAGLVEVERRHRWAYYSLTPEARGGLSSWLS